MSKSYLGGISTDIEVRALREKYPALKVGDCIAHADVESIVGAERRTSRYRTITNRWRSLEEKDHGIIIGADTPTGFKVLDDTEKLNLSGSKLRTSGRMAKKARQVASRIDVANLTEEQKRDFAHATNISAAIIMAARLKPVAELPAV